MGVYRMSVKHFKEYYNVIAEQHKTIVDMLEKFGNEVADGLAPIEKLEQLKAQINPLLVNYDRVNYIMYLLNLPNKKEKQPKYKKLHKKQSERGNSQEVIEENKEVINKVDTIINSTEDELL